MGRAIGSILTAAALSALLAGCGVRGNLEKPGSSAVTPASGQVSDDTAKSSASVKKAHEPSVLDGLLR